MKNLLPISLFLTCGLLVTGCNQKNNNVELNAYPKNGQCSIDVPAQNAELLASENFHIGGWAFNKKNNSTSDDLIVYFKNVKTNELVSVTAKTGHNRPDVAKALNIPGIENSGFNAVMEKDRLAAGTYEIILMQLNKDASAIICDNEPHNITIK